MADRSQRRGAATVFTTLVVRARWIVCAAWVVIAYLAFTTLPSIGGAGGGSLGQLVAADAEAIDTEVRSAELFRFPLLSRTIVVQRDPGGLSPSAQARVLSRVALLNSGRLEGVEAIPFALPVANSLGKPPFSRESSTTALTYLFFEPDVGRGTRIALAEEFAERHVSRPGDAYVGITGAVPARAEEVDRIAEGLPLVEIGTLLVVTLAVAFHFRAVGASIANLLAVGLAYVVASHGVAGVGEGLGIAVPEEIEPVMVALLFGVVTDYSIFFLSRFRARLAEVADPRAAAIETSAETIPIVLAAGLTVAAASASLVVAQLGFYRAFGPGLAVAVLIAMAIAVTFIPALMAICGRALFWPAGLRGGGESAEPSRRGLRGRLLALPTRRPWLVTAMTAIPLLVASLALSGLSLGNTVIRGLPADSGPRQTFRLASEGFAPGILAPTEMLVEGAAIGGQRDALGRLQQRLEARPGIALVVGPGQARAPAAFPTPPELGAVYARGGNAARYLIVLDEDPLSGRAIGVFNRLERDIPGLIEEVGLQGATVGFAGDTALSAETVNTTEEDLVRIGPAAILAVLIVLILYLRALVAPLYLVAASALALTATLGLSVVLFQDVLGQGQLSFYVPFAATVLLLALGSDYNVYLVGRVWSEARRRPMRAAVEIASRRASGAITAAGVVLAASFALLALVPLSAFRELGLTVALGLLIDAFVVRTLLAPALMTIFGERSIWPRRALREDPPR